MSETGDPVPPKTIELTVELEVAERMLVLIRTTLAEKTKLRHELDASIDRLIKEERELTERLTNTAPDQ